MQSVLQELTQAGFQIKSLEADGRIHRYNLQDDHKKCGWAVCYLNHTNDGQPFYVCLYGDWRIGEVNKICTLTSMSGDDNEKIRKQIERAQKEREQEQKRVWEETSVEATSLGKLYGRLDPNNSYIRKKNINGVGAYSDGDTLICPIQDEYGKIWGLQYITTDSKRFLTNCKVKGNFCVLGSISSTMLICEGYATGASLYEATGIPVLVAFQANNLPAVCAKFPDATLTVCGDDDAHKETNTGRIYASKCAAERIIFPRFQSSEGNPTDFNDLHNREGIQAVKDQILDETNERQFVLCLGHREETYYYTSSSNKRIVAIQRAAHNRANLRDLMPESYWNAKYPKKEGADWDVAADALMCKCRAKGIFDETTVKGVGVWKDRDKYLINLGDRLYYDGACHGLDALKGEAIYEIGPKMGVPHMVDIDTSILGNCILNISWKHPDSAKYLIGWLTVAPVSGALAWRPHLWLTGGAGTGKSTIMSSLVRPMLGAMNHYFLGNTTEAGVRQITRNGSKAVIFDEFETEDRDSVHRIKTIIEFMRQASSESEGMIAKGGASGQAMTFRPRFSALVSSIRVSLVNEADRTRFNELELVRGKDESFDEFKKYVAKIDARYAAAYFARTFRLMPILESNIKTFWEVLRMRYTARIGQQYGALLAGYWLSGHDEAITIDEAHKLINSMDISDIKQGIQEKEEMECLDYLMSKVIDLEYSVKKSFSELIQNGTGSGILERYGICEKDEIILVANKHPELTRIFKDTRWATSWGKSLARLEGAERGSHRIGAKTVYCVAIPKKIMFDKV